VVQDVPRRQRIGIGLYDLNGDGRLQRRSLMHAELDAERTVVPGLTSADAVVLNDQDRATAPAEALAAPGQLSETSRSASDGW
jgi:hypothetical protein